MPLDIRPAAVADAEAIQRIYAPIVEQTAISFEDVPPSVEEMAKRIASTSQTYPYLVAVEGGKACGYVYASVHAGRAAYRHSVNTTVHVASETRGNGVGRALYAALLPELARRDFHAAFAGIALPNAASVGLHESVGFEPLGIYREVGFKFGRWHDVGWCASCEKVFSLASLNPHEFPVTRALSPRASGLTDGETALSG